MSVNLPFTISSGASRNVVVLDHRVIGSDWEQWYLLRSDAHWDNPDSNQDLQKQHLDEAIERKAGILDFGDLFCAMQGKYDKRSSKSKVREEHQVDNYLDSLVSTAADFHEPYAHNWVCQGSGNHETSIMKIHETNLLERLAQVLRDRTGAVFPLTGYTGWVWFRFRRGGNKFAKRLWHCHGYGGGGPVTKDMIQRNRQQGYIDADIMCSGHTHDQWVTYDVRMKLDSNGLVKRNRMAYVKCPTYKDEYKTGAGGWHIETGKPPKPLGAYWLRFYLTRKNHVDRKHKREYAIDFEVREALA